MPRRYHYYYFAPEFQPYMLMSSVGSTVLALGLILPAFYLTYSLFKGPRASANPWGAHGLEWDVPSPPPSHNFHEIPIVTDEVYDFDPVTEYEQQRASQEILDPGSPPHRLTKEGDHLPDDGSKGKGGK
jgi:cytochrome c oxidase subunit 1